MPNVRYVIEKGTMTIGEGKNAVTTEVSNVSIQFFKPLKCPCKIYERCPECDPEYFNKNIKDILSDVEHKHHDGA